VEEYEGLVVVEVMEMEKPLLCLSRLNLGIDVWNVTGGADGDSDRVEGGAYDLKVKLVLKIIVLVKLSCPFGALLL